MTDLRPRSASRLPRRRWRFAALAATLAVTTPAAVARADQTVFSDDAGDAPHISLIGDSTLTGVRWYADYGELERYNFVFSAESCRRTIEQSCISQEGYRSANAVAAMRNLDGQLGDVLVLMTGYNDPAATIDEAIEAVVDEARDQNVEHVVWLTLRVSDDVHYSDPQEQSSINTFREYNEQLVEAAEESGDYLQIADWATYSNGASEWFETDGVHLTARGVDAVTSFIAGSVDRVLAGENVSPAATPWTVLVPGAEGDDVAAVQEALIAAGIDVAGGADGVYGNDTMAAVAAYQRTQDGLLVTGAVDIATASALGVYTDPEAAAEPSTTAMPATTVAAVAAAPTSHATGASPVSGASREAGAGEGGGSTRGLLIAGSTVLVLAGLVVGRRRYVVARRADRRWARVHPATSPQRSVADERRTGEVPVTGGPSGAGRIYDQDVDEPASIGSTGE